MGKKQAVVPEMLKFYLSGLKSSTSTNEEDDEQPALLRGSNLNRYFPEARPVVSFRGVDKDFAKSSKKGKKSKAADSNHDENVSERRRGRTHGKTHGDRGLRSSIFRKLTLPSSILSASVDPFVGYDYAA